MSDLLGDIEFEYPKTVTACHAEIRRLEGLLEKADAQIDAKEATIDDLQETVDDFEDGERGAEESTNAAINQFLDECERVGPRRFDVQQSDRTNRAIVALYDVVGRQP